MRAIESRRILLVDDHAAVRHRLALVLTEEGVGECREAAGQEEAFSSASSERPDLALVDLAPGTDDILELVSDPCARNIPVLVSSMHEDALRVRRSPEATSRSARPRVILPRFSDQSPEVAFEEICRNGRVSSHDHLVIPTVSPFLRRPAPPDRAHWGSHGTMTAVVGARTRIRPRTYRAPSTASTSL